MKILGVMLLLVGTMAVASAQVPICGQKQINPGAVCAAPEIDGSSTVSAVALLSGSLLMLARRRKD